VFTIRCANPVASVLTEFDFVCRLLSLSRAQKTSFHVDVIVMGEDILAILLFLLSFGQSMVGVRDHIVN
jgi:hypothetical protein